MPPRNNLRGERRKNGRHVFAAAATLGLVLAGYGPLLPSADAKTVSGLSSKWGRACKMRVVEQFDVPNSDAVVTLDATEQKSIDEGNTSLADVQTYGLSFNWEVRGMRINGYCNVHGKGKITEFKQGL
ncbi:hypothetical protein [Cyanobium sp. AMD-g]|uniref:hypothetical protein n=1 Tax=Cyanobium sp. AMD-g TaxID=2823699 RepID=UPI0020CCAAA8|nr:hypothetical protein [Cyanobium sp. AMD-g]